MAQTRKNRLVFWPPLARNAQLLSADGKNGVTDHITLELGNRKSHVTSFDADGTKNNHRPNAWVLDVREDCSLALWFSLFVPFSILRQQDHEVMVNVPMPTTDTKRRLAEFEKHAASCRLATIEPPPHEFAGDYLCCLFYLQVGKDLSDQGLLIDLRQLGLDKHADGFRDDVPIPFSPTVLQVEGSAVVVYAAVPPGAANTDVMCGFPSRTKGAACR